MKRRAKRQNPSAAEETFEMWNDRLPRSGKKVRVPDPPRTLIQLGKLKKVVYRSDKWDKGKAVDYSHKFDRPYPILATDPSGRDLYIVGGRFEIRPEGIVH